MSAHGLGWNGTVGYVGIPDVTNGVNSRPFTIPAWATVVTVFIPDLVGAGTLELQTLTPDNDGAAEVWTTVKYAGLVTTAPITYIPINNMTDPNVITFPISVFGSGVLRFMSTAAQTGAPDQFTIKVFFGRGN